MESADLYFGNFHLDRQGSLWCDGSLVRAAPKVLALLGYLARRPHQLVSKRELLDAIWGDVHVTEAVLKVHVQQLRRLLGDRPAEPRFVKTEHRRGYRFVAPVRRHDLPSPLGPLVGREGELAAVAERLKERRLVTLTGTGGAGKTRLALAVARAMAARADAPEVYWVELASIAAATGPERGLAGALGVAERAGSSLLESLAAALHPRPVLLILDNCEHLPACGPMVDLLLSRCPSLWVLATSRRPLGVSNETLVAVAPLSIPDFEEDDPCFDGLSPRQLRLFESVRLLVDRIHDSDPDFDLASVPAAAVARICQAVAGLPLAIELVAPRISSLGLQAVADRIHRLPALLGPVLATTEEKHRSIEHTIDWSLRLLDDEPRRLFERLAVFAADFDLSAVEAVCGERVERVARDLALLVESSLLERRDGAGDRRFDLLEPIRQSAASRLESAPERDELVERHWRYFAELVRRREAGLCGAGKLASLSRIDRELAELRLGIARCRSAGRWEEVLDLTSRLLWFWIHTGRWREGSEAIADAVGHLAASRPPLHHRGLYALGVLEFFYGDYSAAAGHFGKALGLPPTPVAAEERSLARSFYSQTLLSLQRRDAAREESRRALDSLGEEGRPFARAIVLVGCGNAERELGELAVARAFYDGAREAAEEAGDDWVLAMAVRNLGVIASRSNDTAAAREHFRHSLRLLRPLPERWFVSRALEELAALAARAGADDRAIHLFGAAERLRSEVGAPIVPFYLEEYETAVDELRRRVGSSHFDREWSNGRSLDLQAALALALED